MFPGAEYCLATALIDTFLLAKCSMDSMWIWQTVGIWRRWFSEVHDLFGNVVPVKLWIVKFTIDFQNKMFRLRWLEFTPFPKDQAEDPLGFRWLLQKVQGNNWGKDCLS